MKFVAHSSGKEVQRAVCQQFELQPTECIQGPAAAAVVVVAATAGAAAAAAVVVVAATAGAAKPPKPNWLKPPV
jgi:hypothetical protein